VYKGGTAGILVELTTLSSVTSYVDSAVEDGVLYRYSVSAFNEAGEGPACEEAEVTVGALAAAPSAPRSVSAKAGNAYVVVSWSAPVSNGNSAITKYSVRRGTSPEGESWLADVAAVTSYNDTGVSNGQTYYYTITATNAVGESPESEEVSATPSQPGAATVPGAPQNISAEAGTGHILVSWYAPASDGGSAVTGYVVYRDSHTRKATPIATVGPVFAYADTDVEPGATYVYFVSAVNAVGEGPATGSANATVPSANGTANETDGDTDWLKDWTWMHSAAMLGLMGVAVAGTIWWMSHPEEGSKPGNLGEADDSPASEAGPKGPASAAESPDEGVDGKPDED
jgi:hypothetical protein